MRILCVDPEPSSRRGGQEWSMLDECRGLVALGHEVTLGYSVAGDLLPQYEAGGVRTLELGNIILAGGRATGAMALGRAVARALRARPEIVCLNQYHESLFGGTLARVAGIPLACHVRLFPPDALCGQWRLGVSQVTRFIAVSRAVKDAWVAERGADPARVDVVHDGVDMSRFRQYANRDAVRVALGVPRDAFVVLYAGRLDRTKNLEGLLRAFAGIGLGPDRARLLVAGRPVDHASPEAGEAYVQSLKDLAASSGIGSQVHWLGSRPDVPELLSASDSAALFQLYPEPLARAAYEALACGVPIVCQAGGGMAEVLSGEFRRFIFDGAHPEQAVALFRSLVDWRRTDPGLGDRARAHAVAGFSREAMVAGIEASLKRAMTTEPRHRGPARARLRERRVIAPLAGST